GLNQGSTLGQRQRREQARDEFVSILSERDGTRRIIQQAPESRLDERSLFRRTIPLGIDKVRGVEPRALLRVERHVRPGLMGMAREEHALGHAKPQIIPGEFARSRCHSCDRIAQKSGKIGRPMVSRRYAAPADPPVPGLVPIVRSTIFTWRYRHSW